MADKMLFALRRAESPDPNQLEGAFRIQIPLKELRNLGLKTGEHCLLSTEDGTKTGLAIAWQSIDPKESGKKIIKITDRLKETYGFSLEDRVWITKTDMLPRIAESVSVSNVTNGLTLESEIEDHIKFCISSSLARVKFLVVPGTFKVEKEQAPGELQRFVFLLEEITSKSSHEQNHNISWPVQYFGGVTKIRIINEAQDAKSTFVPRHAPRITLEGIGGLKEEVNKLNDILEDLTDELSSDMIPLEVKNEGIGILLYGASGTGKSLLLQKIADADWASTYRIDRSTISASVSQTDTKIKAIFEQAARSIPSVIIIDNLEKIAGRPDDTGSTSWNTADCLATAMDKARGQKILVVAATPSLLKVDPNLRKATFFPVEIEIPVPNVNSRIEILNILQRKDRNTQDTLSEMVSQRTHGYVGLDLKALYIAAWKLCRREHRMRPALTNFGPLEHSFDMHQINGSSMNGADMLSKNTELLSNTETQAPLITFQHFEQALKTVSPSAMKEIFLEKPSVRWTDIGGSDSVRKALVRVTSWPFLYPELFQKLGLKPSRGILLYGPPGCSKTLCAKAAATETGFNFLAVKGSELISKYVGESERAMREIFAKAKAARPSIIFFDEIDAIAASRSSHEHTSGLNTVTTLLNEMDGFEEMKDVLVLAATNIPEMLDAALLRPGRFDEKIYIGLPDYEARKQIVQIATRNGRVSQDIATGMHDLVMCLEGYTGAEIVQICQQAAQRALDEIVERLQNNASFSEEIGLDNFEQAIREQKKGVTTESLRKFKDWEKRVSSV